MDDSEFYYIALEDIQYFANIYLIDAKNRLSEVDSSSYNDFFDRLQHVQQYQAIVDKIKQVKIFTGNEKE